MMMKIYLVRHSEAAYTRPDSKRELTENGIQLSIALAAMLPPGLQRTINAIEHSPFARAQQTAALIRQHALPKAALRAVGDITPEDDPAVIGATLWQSKHDRMIVGHNPHLEVLTHRLLGLHHHLFNFSKSALVILKLAGEPTLAMPWGRWQLSGLIKPKLRRADRVAD